MKKRKKIGRKLLSFLLTLALVFGLMPGMGLTAYAAPTEELLTTITATGKEQASYSTENVATVSFSYTANGYSRYTNNGTTATWGWWGYGWTATVTPADGYTITKCVFYDDKDRTATDSEAPFVVETTEEDKTPKVNGTPILANTSKGITKIEVYGYVTPATSYSVTITAGDNMTKTTGSGDAEQTGLTGAMTDVVYTADNGYYFPTDYSVAEVSGIKVTRDSYTQITVSGTPTADATITLTAPTAKTTPDAPTTASATDCTTADNNDGTLTGVTTAMEYKKSDAADWTDGTGSDITGLVPGTYYVRVKATDTTNASGNQELTIKGFISYTVTFTVVNGKWNEGEGDAATADKTVTLTGHDGDTLKLTADQIPAVGSKPNDTYKAGSWDVMPNTDTAITEATTYTYTYIAKETSVVTKAPEAKTLTYNGSAQELVTAGTATGGEMQYALGTKDAATEEYTTSIPKGTDVGTYYVWYKGVGDGNHNDSTPDCITVTIGKKAATINANAASKTYGDADPTLTANMNGVVGTEVLQYTLSRAAGENVNNYAITVTVEATANPNYDITVNGNTFTINKKALTITADSATKVYDTTALTKDSYTNTDLATGDSIESVTITGSQTTAASSDNVPSAAVIKKSGTDVTANYEITYVNGTLTVSQANTNTVAVDITGWTYGDSANAPTSEASFGANTVTYSYSDAQDGTYTATVPVNAGTWYVKASVAGTANYVAGEATKSFTITKREVVISGIVAVDKNYDETTNAPLDFSKVSIANLVAADAGKLSVTATGTFEDEKVGKDKKVTISDLALSGDAAGNYVLAAEGQQTESKADISNMTTETGSGTDGYGDFIARVEDFNLNIKKVEGLDLELGKALCTPAELAMYEAGAKIELDLEIRVAEGLMTDDVVSKVTGILWNQEHVTMHGAKYFDITLYKKVGDAAPVPVTNLGDKSITIKIGVPENMKNTNGDKTRTFFMVRMHDGEAAVLTRTTSEELTFNTSLFSTYAICYNDAPVWRPTQQTTSSNNTVTATVVSPKTSGTDETARTLLVFGTAFAVAAIVSRIYVFGRRKEEEE